MEIKLARGRGSRPGLSSDVSPQSLPALPSLPNRCGLGAAQLGKAARSSRSRGHRPHRRGASFGCGRGKNARLTLEQGTEPDPHIQIRTREPPLRHPERALSPRGGVPSRRPAPRSSSLAHTHGRAQRPPFQPKLGSQGQHPRTVRGGRGHRGRPGWVPPETVAGVPKVASWVPARPRGGAGTRGVGWKSRVR